MAAGGRWLAVTGGVSTPSAVVRPPLFAISPQTTIPTDDLEDKG